MSGGSERERLAAAVDAIEQFIETGTGFPGGTPRFHARAALVVVKDALAHVAEDDGFWSRVAARLLLRVNELAAERARLVAGIESILSGETVVLPGTHHVASDRERLRALLADPAAATPDTTTALSVTREMRRPCYGSVMCAPCYCDACEYNALLGRLATLERGPDATGGGA